MMRDMLRLFSRPAMRTNPHSWLAMFEFDALTLAYRDDTHAMSAVYRTQIIGTTPAWLNA